MFFSLSPSTLIFPSLIPVRWRLDGFPSPIVLLPPAGVFHSFPAEDAFLSAVINYANSSTVHFKLSPAYILYAAGHFALRCQRYRRGSTPSGQKHSVKSITNKMVAMTEKVIQASRRHRVLFLTFAQMRLTNQQQHQRPDV